MMRKSCTFLRSLLAPVLLDRRGVAAVFLAVALIPLIGAVGLAVDSSLGYLVKVRMGKSLDTAGLAAGRVALDENAGAVARQYFDANFGRSSDAIEVESFDFEVDPTYRYVTLSATAKVPTLFMRVFGNDTMEVGARAVIERETTGMELALVLDNTGSMQDDDKFETMQDAALDLVDILYGEKDTIDNLWVSVVPFVTTVNIGTANSAWIKASDLARTKPSDWGTVKAGKKTTAVSWKGCILARANPLDTSDTPPSGNLFSSFRWTSPPSGSDYNYTCPAAILPLTASKTKIDAALKAMAAAPKAGGTATNFGTVWGWRTLSPRWRGLWSGGDATLPLDYDTPQMEKVAVVLTDGENQLLYDQYTGYGYPSALGYKKTADSTDMLNARMITVCDAMKAKHIRVFSIMFGKGNDKKAKDLLKSCATSEAMYYDAVTNADLQKAFKAIGGQLANLRIVE
jgi:Flp pilus assembly protein TadG